MQSWDTSGVAHVTICWLGYVIYLLYVYSGATHTPPTCIAISTCTYTQGLDKLQPAPASIYSLAVVVHVRTVHMYNECLIFVYTNILTLLIIVQVTGLGSV